MQTQITMKEIQEHNGKKYYLFWNGVFSNWHISPFEINGIKYNCGEQFMMYQKALLFDDQEIADEILQTSYPKIQKKLGRKVRNFNPKSWDVIKYPIVKTGLKEKFEQNPKLKEKLLQHKDCIFVEASPYDRIWGIGFAEHEAIDNFDKWGENLLGEILTEIANEL